MNIVNRLQKTWWLWLVLLVGGVWAITAYSQPGPLLHTLETGEQMVMLAYSPDGQWIATGSERGTIVLWDAASGKEMTRWQAHTARILDLAFHPAGQQLLSVAADQRIRRWNLPGLQPIEKPASDILITTAPVDAFYTKPIFQRVAWSEDGEWIAAASRDGRIFLFAAETGALLDILQAYTFNTDYYEYFTYLSVHRGDNLILAAGSFQSATSIQAWDLSTRSLLFQSETEDPLLGYLGLPIPYRGGVRFDAHTKTLWWINSNGSTITSQNLTTSQEQVLTIGMDLSTPPYGYQSPNEASSFALSQDGILLAVGGGIVNREVGFLYLNDNRIRLWKIGEGEPSLWLKGHRDTIIALAFSPDRKQLASLGWDKTLRIWQIAP